jgi:hypothetical protein
MAANETFKINVYDNEGNVIKTSTAVDCDLKFGAIRKIMALLEIEDINDIASLLKTVYGAWDQVIKVLSECFPDMTDDDWDNVKVNELIPTTVALVKAMVAKMLTIPSESKN